MKEKTLASRRLLRVFLLGLVLSSVVMLVGQPHSGTINGLLTADIASLIVKIAFLVFLSGSVLMLFRENFSRALEAAMFWLVIAVLLGIGYTYRHDLQEAGDRVMTELIPGRAFTKGHVVEVARGRGGDFNVSASINGVRAPMALDTGASAVVLTYETAKSAGLPIELLSYSVNVDTANGRTQAAAVTLDRIGVGGVIERAVPALIAKQGQLKTNLLGMTFLNRLQSWEVRGDKLILRGYP